VRGRRRAPIALMPGLGDLITPAVKGRPNAAIP
jgi:hypothetical protein